MEVGFFIGFNCFRAIKLFVIILRKESDLYVKRIVIGWGIIGIVETYIEDDVEIESEVACNRKRLILSNLVKMYVLVFSLIFC